MKIYAAKAHLSRKEVGIIKIIFLCMPFALTKDKRSKRQFFKVLNGGQFILSVDNTRLSFFMDPTSELFILSNKG